MTQQDNTEFAEDRIEHYEQLEEQGHNPYVSDSLEPTSEIESFREFYTNEETIQDETEWILAGRITRVNSFGDFVFYDIDDRTDSVQVMCHNEQVEEYDLLSHINTGDHVLFTGVAEYSNTGELTLNAHEFTITSKSLNEHSTDWNSLGEQQQVEQRTSALVTDDDLFDSVRIRFQIQREIRNILESQGFLEVETPTIDNYSGGNASESFDTYCEALNNELSLRVAPELYLKRLITAGYSHIFEIARCYRNESIDTTHNPEFTMLELYQTYADYEDMMEIVEQLVYESSQRVLDDSESVVYNGVEIDLTPSWERRTFDSLVDEYIENNIGSHDEEIIRQHICTEYDSEISEDHMLTDDELLLELFERAIEPSLQGPIFVTDYPTVSTPLCQTLDDDESRVQRFEAFISGMEIANAYTELTNPIEQHERLSETSEDINSEFIQAISNGMPPTGGLGLGIDRVAMIITDSQSIKDVLPYPLTVNRT